MTEIVQKVITINLSNSVTSDEVVHVDLDPHSLPSNLLSSECDMT